MLPSRVYIDSKILATIPEGLSQGSKNQSLLNSILFATLYGIGTVLRMSFEKYCYMIFFQRAKNYLLKHKLKQVSAHTNVILSRCNIIVFQTLAHRYENHLIVLYFTLMYVPDPQ